MTRRPELRRQWREENRERQERNEAPLSWREWLAPKGAAK